MQPEQAVVPAREQRVDLYISIVYDRQPGGDMKPFHAEMEGNSYEIFW